MKPLLPLAVAAFLIAGSAQAAETLRDLCPDRPAKGTAPCTVDAGHLQLEMDLVDVTHDRSAGARSTTTLLASPQLKLGLTPNLDLEAAWSPYQRQSDSPGGHATGVGDLYLKAKANLTGNRDDGWNLALIPYLKAPTASHGLGNGVWEGGLLAAAAGDLPHGWSLNLTPEVDLVEDGGAGGKHAAVSMSAGLTHALGGGLSATGELWAARDYDPAGHASQVSGDLALEFIPKGRPNLQWDLGVNLGLNRNTPDVQAYAGVSRRF